MKFQFLPPREHSPALHRQVSAV